MHHRYETSTLLTFVQTESNLCWYVHEWTDTAIISRYLSGMLQEKQ